MDGSGFKINPVSEHKTFITKQGMTLAVGKIHTTYTNNTIMASIPIIFSKKKKATYFYDPPIGNVYVEIPLDAPEKFTVHATIPEIEVDDEMVAVLLPPQLQQAGSAFRATLGGEARVELSRGKPLVSATGFLKDASLSAFGWTLENAALPGVSVELRNNRLRTTEPLVATFDTLTHESGFTLGPGEFQGRASANEFYLEKASVGWGEGAVRAYAIHFNPAAPDVETRVYFEHVDVGNAFALFPAFDVEGSGLLYGELPVAFKNRRVHFGNGFLYSPPGETGELRFRDPSKIQALLAMAGVTEAAGRDIIAEALSHVAFTLLRLDLDASDPRDARLRVRVAGESLHATRRGTPVDVTLNFRAPLDELLDLGFNVNERLGY